MVFDSSTIRRANSLLAIAQFRAQTMPHERATGLDGDRQTPRNVLTNGGPRNRPTTLVVIRPLCDRTAAGKDIGQHGFRYRIGFGIVMVGCGSAIVRGANEWP
jgi:hypothetical protein